MFPVATCNSLVSGNRHGSPDPYSIPYFGLEATPLPL